MIPFLLFFLCILLVVQTLLVSYLWTSSKSLFIINKHWYNIIYDKATQIHNPVIVLARTSEDLVGQLLVGFLLLK